MTETTMSTDREALVRVLNRLWRDHEFHQPTIGEIADAVLDRPADPWMARVAATDNLDELAAVLREWLAELQGGPKHARPIDCPDHKPVQHRDGRPPWCPRCGCDIDGNQQRDAPSPIGRRA